MMRGDVVVVALPGDYGKPRPALIVQSDRFVDHPSVTVLPITSHRVEAPLPRVDIGPECGVERPSPNFHTFGENNTSNQCTRFLGTTLVSLALGVSGLSASPERWAAM